MQYASDGADHENLLRIVMAHRAQLVDRQQTVRLIEQWRETPTVTPDLQLDAVPLLGDRERRVLDELVQLYLASHEGPLEAEILQLTDDTERLADPTSIQSVIQQALATFTPESTARDSGSPPPLPESIPADDGRFQIKHELARGGLGTVFVAEDRQIPRDVAVKEIPERYLGHPDFLRRFILEAEITGALEHPGIVPIYAMGKGKNGQPYYAMRLISGRTFRESIDDYHASSALTDASQRRLDFRRLLTQFNAVCHAIQYAHDRGVLHRDIKPDNIMIGPNNETVVVDWGIAKLLDSQHNESEEAGQAQDSDLDDRGRVASTVNETLRMRNRERESKDTVGVVGTPAFMSPEQALGWNDSLAPASDVYSLGATLYYLLTGKSPYSGGDAMEAVVVARTGKFAPPRSEKADTPRALEAICLKAMSGSAGDRYATPTELAADIEAYLADEPVSAWREPLLVRSRRWLRNHRTALVGLTAAVTVALLILSVTSVVLTAANRREKQARQEAETQRDRARQNLRLARSVVDRYLTRIGEDPRLSEAGLDDLRKELFAAAKDFYARLVKDPASDRALQVDQAWAKFRLAVISSEIDTPTVAIGQYRDALKTFQSLQIPAGQADTSFNLSLALRESGRTAEAHQALTNTLDLCDRLSRQFPQNVALRRRAAACFVLQSTWLQAADKPQEAKRLLVKALAVRQELAKNSDDPMLQSELAETYEILAVVNQDEHNYDESAGNLQRAKTLRQRIVDRQPRSPFHRNALAITVTSIADLQLKRGELDAAKSNYQAALAAQNALMDSLVRITSYRQRLASILNNFAGLLATRGENKEAIEQYRASIRVNQSLLAQRPQEPIRRKLLAMSFTNLADLVLRNGDFKEALDLQTRARAIYSELFAGDRENAKLRTSLADCQRNIGDIDLQRRKFKSAEENFQAAVKLLTEVKLEPTDNYRHSLGSTFHSLGMLYTATNRPQRCKKAYLKAVEQREKLVAATNGAPDHRASLASTFVNLAHLAVRTGKPKEADERYTQAIRLVERGPRTHQESRRMLVAATAARGLLRGEQRDAAAAAKDLQAALAQDRGEFALVIEVNLARFQALAGNHRESYRRCGTLHAKVKGAGSVLYRLARTCSLCAAAAAVDKALDAKARQAAIKKYSGLAATLLAESAQAGHFRDVASAKLLDGPEWKALRNEPWFRSFRAKVKK